MESVFKYLKEREEYFFNEDLSNLENPQNNYGLGFIDNEFNAEEIPVDKVPDTSVIVRGIDDLMNPDSELQSKYSDGKLINISDNQEFYEVVKLVKDMTDRHIYMRDMTWSVNIADNKAIFTFKLDKVDSKEDYFLEGIKQYVISKLFMNFGNLFDVDSESLKDANERSIMKIIVEKKKDNRKRLKKIKGRADSNTFVTKSSVSRM
ncbi:MAG: hypothetical protein ACOC1K_07910 [Nanoarchaeota archaeon]